MHIKKVKLAIMIYFIQGVKFKLLTNGLGDILQHGPNLNAKFVKNVVKLRLHDHHQQVFHEKLHKFENLSICKRQQHYECSSYLDKIKNVKLRNIFTKLRLGCNRLNAYSHSDKTDCDHCMAPETVSHMLFDCESHNIKSSRDKFLDQIQSVYPTFTALSNTDKLSRVLNLNFKDENVISMACSFVKTIYNLRFSRNP